MYIKGLHELAEVLLYQEVFENVCMINIVVAVILFFVFLKHPMPYGRLGKKYVPRMNVTVNTKLAFFLFNIIPLLLFLYIIFDYAENFKVQPITVETITWIVFRLYRGTIYALKRSRFADPWPLETVLFYLVQNIDLALVAARTAMVDLINPFTPRCIISLIFFVLAFFFGAYYDFRASKNRYKAPNAYKIIKGGLFEKVTAPNLFCELVLWISWCVMVKFDLGSITILVWQLPSLIGRAESYHRWSKKNLIKYPENRKSIIPFIDLGNLVNAFLDSLQYGGL